jgi:D-alanyl-D-alanine carboxypeptidase
VIVIHCDGLTPARKFLVPVGLGRRALRLVLSAVLVALFLLPVQAWAKYASIVINAQTGQVLSQNNADVRNYPASLTKMMTLYLLFDALDAKKVSMQTPMKVSAHAAGQAPSKLGLRVGSTITVENAIKALVTKSANDVAVVIAEALGGTETKFAQQMTQRARALGMTRTTFRNANGLPDNGQMSTARDMATLSLALQNNHAKYYHFFSLRSFQYNGQTYSTHNRVLLNYAGADGLKTGYIRASGFNLAASAKRNGVRLVGVVFGGKTSRWRDQHMMELLDSGFARSRAVASADVPVPVAKPDQGSDSALAVTAPQALPGTVMPVVPLSKPQSMANLDSSAPPAPPLLPARQQPGAVPLSADLKSSWGVQVGAFSQLETARQQADKAAVLLRRQSGAAKPAVTSVVSGTSVIYRSRVLGLDSENTARRACNDLRGQRFHCVVVRPGSMDVAFLPSPGHSRFDAE